MYSSVINTTILSLLLLWFSDTYVLLHGSEAWHYLFNVLVCAEFSPYAVKDICLGLQYTGLQGQWWFFFYSRGKPEENTAKELNSPMLLCSSGLQRVEDQHHLP